MADADIVSFEEGREFGSVGNVDGFIIQVLNLPRAHGKWTLHKLLQKV